MKNGLTVPGITRCWSTRSVMVVVVSVSTAILRARTSTRGHFMAQRAQIREGNAVVPCRHAITDIAVPHPVQRGGCCRKSMPAPSRQYIQPWSRFIGRVGYEQYEQGQEYFGDRLPYLLDHSITSSRFLCFCAPPMCPSYTLFACSVFSCVPFLFFPFSFNFFRCAFLVCFCVFFLF